MSKIIQADVVFTNTGAPILNGGLAVDKNGIILDIFSQKEMLNKKADEIHRGFLIPGFVNAHCHLELSFAVARIERNKGINHFIGRLEHLKKTITPDAKRESIEYALESMVEEGIVAVGDICNTDLTADVKKKSSMKFRNFIEVYGLDESMADQKMQEAKALKSVFENASIVPHSTYSLSQKLLQLLDKQILNKDILSIHHQESESENQYFKEGKGNMAERFKDWGLTLPDYIPSGKSPMETFLDFVPMKSNPVILVHNTFTREQDLRFIRHHFSNPNLCLCPSSNLFIENKLPDVSLVASSGIDICLGTDSLASNDILSILHEIKILKKNYPELPLSDLIKWGTLNGAKALGFDNEIGSFEKGKKPGILLIEDVETEKLELTDFSFVRILG